MAEVMRLKPVTGCGETVGRPADVVQRLHEVEPALSAVTVPQHTLVVAEVGIVSRQIYQPANLVGWR